LGAWGTVSEDTFKIKWFSAERFEMKGKENRFWKSSNNTLNNHDYI
jgi:hypothetical protein